jgi:pimeloyl-ACP methyl ester carboxylesterase
MENQAPQSPRKQELLVTRFGNIKVSIVGKPSRPAMITYPDIGLDNRACFNSFLKHQYAQDMMEGFCVYNIDAPGQESGAAEMGANDSYPKLEELADQLQEVVNHFEIQKFIGFGVGVGATVLIHYAAKFPAVVKGLILLSPAVRKMGWLEWSYFKAISAALKMFGMSDWAKSQLLSRYYGSKTLSKNKELTDATEGALERMNAVNISKFMDSFMTREDISAKLADLKCGVSLFYGKSSGWAADETLYTYSKLPKSSSSSIVAIDNGGVLTTEEFTEAMIEPIRLYLIGLGFKFSDHHVLTSSSPNIIKKE